MSIILSENFMKKLYQIFLLVVIILCMNSCFIFNASASLHANNIINQSELSAENKIFQKEVEIDLLVVKRGLWSAQFTFRNNAVKTYYNNLLNNDLIYSLNNIQEAFARQNVQYDNTNIIII